MAETIAQEVAHSSVGLVGESPAFRKIVSQITVLADAPEAVLVCGESGTGKERVARAIHKAGSRSTGPFVTHHCGSQAAPESERSGSERAAPGEGMPHLQSLRSQSAGGTVFLDGVELLPPSAQVALLRVLEDGSAGDSRDGASRVRFIAGTSVPLEPLVTADRFRADLFYRLAVFALTLPPLRDRREDVLPLAEHFIALHAREEVPLRLSAAAVQALMTYDWPGNVRELESAIVRATHRTRTGTIEAADLGLPLASGLEPPPPYKVQKRRILDAFERNYLTRLMAEHAGNVTHAAITAGKERRDLGKLLKRHGIDPRQYIPARH